MYLKLVEPLNFEQEDFLRGRMNVLLPDETIIDYKSAGEGNMNVVLRVLTQKQSFILKQSRPYVNKYPQVAAPFHRISIEKAFYDCVSKEKTLSGFIPKVLDYHEENQILALEDLGEGKDFSGIYLDKIRLNDTDGIALMQFLKVLHQVTCPDFPTNSEMKKLNHEHIFIFPFNKNTSFDLNQIQPGLEDVASRCRNHPVLSEKVAALGKRYLSRGNHLLHGDFYPGSWLKTGSGVKVIDMEFAFLGDREFDLGVMAAHLMLAKTQPSKIRDLKHGYGLEGLDMPLLSGFTGVEILRRLFGLAQLPLGLTLPEKKELAERASNLIIYGEK